MGSFYPTLVSDRWVETVNFYEDFFGFAPMIEQDGFVLTRRQGHPTDCLAIFSHDHRCVASLERPSNGVVVNIVEHDVRGRYDALYMEGLPFHRTLGKDIVGADHFVVYDPNGLMINVHGPYAPVTVGS